MTYLLPLIALIVTVLSHFVLSERREFHFELPRALASLALTAVAAGLIARFAPMADRTGLEVGLVAGVVAVWLGSWSGQAGFGVVAAAGLHLMTPGLGSAQLALMAGLGLGALVIGGEAAVSVVLFGTACAAADYLGAAHADAAGASVLGTQVGIAALVGILLARFVPEKISATRPLVVLVATLALAYFAARNLAEESLSMCVGLGALAGAVIHWMLPKDEDPEVTRIGVATLIGIGLATVAFGWARGLGMGLSLVAAVGALAAGGNARAVLTLGPLIGLIYYRLLRESGTGAARALDLGQHYTLIALVIGAVVPLLPVVRRQAVPAFLWGLILLAVPPLVTVLFGMRGAVGFIVGAGVSGLFQAVRADRNLEPLALSALLAGVTVPTVGWLAQMTDVTRDEKIRFFAFAGAGIWIAAGLLAVLAKREKAEVRS